MQNSPVPSPWQFIKENIPLLMVALVLALLLRFFVAEPRYIPSDSMLPTLEQGDRLVVEKVSYHFHPPQVGDIIVFHPPELLQVQGYDLGQAFIKRVIALPGQTVEVNNGIVYRDGQPLQEEYILEPPQYNLPAVRVPDGQVFVMGDNRNNSNDSHVWGFLPQQNIIGHALFRFFPANRWGQLASFTFVPANNN
jgi:signal peptidase I